MTLPLLEFLSDDGSYEGFDIVPAGIDWCQSKITADMPNFKFQLADIYNKTYNSQGTQKADEFVFPYETDSFDFIFLTSVFTHMFPADMENYLSEISRVLRSGGRCLITYFLLNSESLKLFESGASTLDFKYKFDDFRTIDEKTPEAAIAFDEEFIRNLFDKYHLEINEPIHYGSWCGRPNYLSYQDIIIAVKT